MTITGTAYFTLKEAAYRYYKDYGCDREAVDQKIAEGQIHIGRPPIKAGEEIVRIDNGTRYAVVSR